MTVIGSDTDPIVFLTNILTGQTKDASNNVVPVYTMYPRQALTQGKFPSVVIYQKTPRQGPLNIGSTRYRHFVNFSLNCLAMSVQDRYSIELSVKNTIYNTVKNAIPNPSTLANNYIYMFVKDQENQDDVKTFGTNIYRSVLTIELIFDLVP